MEARESSGLMEDFVRWETMECRLTDPSRKVCMPRIDTLVRSKRRRRTTRPGPTSDDRHAGKRGKHASDRQERRTTIKLRSALKGDDAIFLCERTVSMTKMWTPFPHSLSGGAYLRMRDAAAPVIQAPLPQRRRGR